jgi:outer membrane protein assembly factor BamA
MKSRKIISLIFALLFITAPLISQPVLRDVRIHGARKVNRSLLFQSAKLVKNKPLAAPMDSIRADLLKAYRAQGFYQARIDSFRSVMSTDSAKTMLDVWFHEGEPVRTGRLTIAGIDSAMIPELNRLLSLHTGGRFFEDELRDNIELILNYMENHGHPLAEVTIQSLMYDSSSAVLDIALQAEPGLPIYIGEYRLKGNTLTRPEVILREIQLKAGMPYRHDALMQTEDKLQRLHFFDRVYPPDVRFVKDHALVTIQVQEGSPNTMDGVVGYTPSNDPDRPGYFTGQLHLSFRNLFGTGRFFEAFWEKKDKHSQMMRFGYEEPWLRGWPVFPGGYFTQEIRDTTYVDRGWRLRVRYAPWNALSLSVEGGQREILPDSLGSILYGLAKTRSWLGTLGIDYSTYDDPLNPTRGLYYHTAATFGRKRNLGPAFMDTTAGWRDAVNTRHIRIDAEYVQPVMRRQVIFIGVHGQEVKSGGQVVPLSEQIRFGGTRTLRGYPEDLFRGSIVAWMNLEYRYLMGRRSRVFIFMDSGLYQRRERTLELKRGQKIGYGFGVRLETRLGIMGVDYGLGEGDDFMQGKIHVGLTNSF